MSTDLDVAVVGGGLVGAAIAYGLADGRRRIAMFDEGDRAYRASRGNFGLVWVQGKGVELPAYAEWTRQSAALWPDLAGMLRSETGIDVALEQPGGLHLCLSNDEAQERAAMVRRAALAPKPTAAATDRATAACSAANAAADVPCSFEMLDHGAAAKLVPGLGRDVVAASYCSLDGHVNPLRVLRALHAGFVRRGGRHVAPAAVSTIDRDGSGFVLHSPQGRFAAARVVIAAGLGSEALATQVGIRVPLRAVRGHIIALQRMERFLDHPIDTLRQTNEGTVLIGDSHDERGPDESTSVGILAAMAERAVRAVPSLSTVPVNRTWAALRVLTPDGFPVYQHSTAHPGAWVATCHSGVTLAAVHVLRLAPEIAADRHEGALQDFSADRFTAAGGSAS